MVTLFRAYKLFHYISKGRVQWHLIFLLCTRSFVLHDRWGAWITFCNASISAPCSCLVA